MVLPGGTDRGYSAWAGKSSGMIGTGTCEASTGIAWPSCLGCRTKTSSSSPVEHLNASPFLWCFQGHRETIPQLRDKRVNVNNITLGWAQPSERPRDSPNKDLITKLNEQNASEWDQSPSKVAPLLSHSLKNLLFNLRWRTYGMWSLLACW